MTRWDRRPWANWLGNVVVDRPERHYYPTTLHDLIGIVADAERQTPPRTVRASGSHWALSDVAAGPDWFVETDALTDTLTSVVPHALAESAREEIARRPPGTGQGFTYYHVQAGITVRALNERLDADPRQRWSLPTMGGAAGQTLAGAMSTGTHGGDHGLPPMADFVQAIHLVTSGGRQLWIERDPGITDPKLLAEVLPAVEQHRSTSLFNAALVAVGRMGIIYSLVIRVVEQFSLDQIIVQSTWEQSQGQLRAPFPIFTQPPPKGSRPAAAERTHFVEVVMSPYAADDGRHVCYITLRWSGPDGPRLPPPRKTPFTLICRHRTLRPVVLALLAGDAASLLLTKALAPGAKPVIRAQTVTLPVLALLLPVSGEVTVGGLVAAACNAANRAHQPWLVRRLTAQVLRQARPRRRIQDVGYHIMDLGRTGADCYRGDSLEVAFDATAGEHVRFVCEDLFPAFERMAAQGVTVPCYISLRFTRKSAALLAMQRWDPTCSIEVAVLKGIRGSETILDTLQTAAVRRGGTVHWGQHNTLDGTAVQRAFPQLPQWRAEAALVMGTQHETFDSPFCRTRGLLPSR
ncbi:FAD-binding protein [Streptomyces sp. NPDC059786]|uniref:FAD-binding protein n=1 Tax=Streptomyces sp. NPDC059786 TaxID=3346946 RepID=UPI003654B128